MFKQFKQVTLVGLCWLALVILLISTNPHDAPMPILFIPFIVLFAALFFSFKLLMSKLCSQMPSRKINIYAGMLSGLPCLLLIMSSINQLTWRDTVLMVLVILALLLYSSRLHLVE